MSRFPFAASVQGLWAQLGMLVAKRFEMEAEFVFHPTRKWRFDVALPELKIAAEYHGGLFIARRGGHQSVKGTRRDWEKLNEAQLLGWMVFQFGPDETRTGEAMNVIDRAIGVRLKRQ